MIINICKGWGCDIVRFCEAGRYIPERERDGNYVREFVPTTPGEGCPDYQPKKKPAGWGVGADQAE